MLSNLVLLFGGFLERFASRSWAGGRLPHMPRLPKLPLGGLQDKRETSQPLVWACKNRFYFLAAFSTFTTPLQRTSNRNGHDPTRVKGRHTFWVSRNRARPSDHHSSKLVVFLRGKKNMIQQNSERKRTTSLWGFPASPS